MIERKAPYHNGRVPVFTAILSRLDHDGLRILEECIPLGRRHLDAPLLGLRGVLDDNDIPALRHPWACPEATFIQSD